MNDLLYDGAVPGRRRPPEHCAPVLLGRQRRRTIRTTSPKAGGCSTSSATRTATETESVRPTTSPVWTTVRALSFRWTVLDREEIGEAAQLQWRALGIDLVLDKVPGPSAARTGQRPRLRADLRAPAESRIPMLLDMIWNSANDVVGGWAWTGFVDSGALDRVVRQLRMVPGAGSRLGVTRARGAANHHGQRTHVADPERAHLLRGLRPTSRASSSCLRGPVLLRAQH